MCTTDLLILASFPTRRSSDLVKADGTYETVASDLGVACGLAFDDEGWLYVGDRSGTIFRVRDGRAQPFATLPPDRKSTRLNSSHLVISYAVFCLKKKKKISGKNARDNKHECKKSGVATGTPEPAVM